MFPINLTASDVIAIAALIATGAMWFRNYQFEHQVRNDQENWQMLQEDQRRRERAEDLERAEDEATPKLRVSVTHGSRSWGPSAVAILIIKVQNIGKVGVFIDPPFFQEPHGEYIHTIYATVANPSSWKDDPIATVEFPFYLQPTQACEVQWVRHHLENYLRQGHSGVVQIKGMIRSGIGMLYESDDYEMDLSDS